MYAFIFFMHLYFFKVLEKCPLLLLFLRYNVLLVVVFVACFVACFVVCFVVLVVVFVVCFVVCFVSSEAIG